MTASVNKETTMQRVFSIGRLIWVCMIFAWSVTDNHAHAQANYPSRPIRVIVPWGAGSSPDIIGRYWGERLQRALGQPIVFENRPGAAGNIGAQAAVTAQADGYTLLYTVGSATSLNPYVYPKLPYRVEDLAPILRVLNVPYVLITSPTSPYKSVADVVNAAKAQPSRLNYASYGTGGTPHALMEMFAASAGIKLSHIPYRDGVITDLVSGRVELVFEPSTTAIPQIKSGKVNALAISSSHRIEALPGVPPVSEVIPGFAGVSWHGLFAPRGTPPELIARLSLELNKIVQTEEFKAKARELGLEAVGGTAADLQRFMAEDARLWSKVVKENDIKVE
jgi:tripartite-type tricarboxylate transporter receptor subunit TctC